MLEHAELVAYPERRAGGEVAAGDVGAHYSTKRQCLGYYAYDSINLKTGALPWLADAAMRCRAIVLGRCHGRARLEQERREVGRSQHAKQGS